LTQERDPIDALEDEASKRLSPSTRALDPSVPWKEMAGMRDKLIHAYEMIDVEVVLRTVLKDIPQTELRLHALLKRLESGSR